MVVYRFSCHIRRALLRCLIVFIGISAFASARSIAADASAPALPPAWDTYSDTWVGEDALGRALPTFDDVGAPPSGHHTGIFYFVHTRDGPWPPRDITQILQTDPTALSHPSDPIWNPEGTPHFWSEPLFGYYSIRDPAVLRKHAQMLNDADVEMLLFDTSNGINYEQTVNALGETFSVMRHEGMTTPQFAFHCVAQTGRGQVSQLRKLYEEYYKPGKFADLWFRWRGKPLVIAGENSMPQEMRSFFTFRKAFWLGMNPGPGSWTLDGYYPREDARQIMKTADGRVEQIAVATASSVVGHLMSSEFPASGRRWHLGVKNGTLDMSSDAIDRGIQYQDEWNYALQLDPKFVLNYCWNEWTAGRYRDPAGKVMFVDEFNEEFSKDIEPMKGGFGDDYYMQMVANDRRYKGVRQLPMVRSQPIKLDGTFDAWNDVQPEFRDDIGDPVHRDFKGWGADTHYTNQTGRNDIVAAKVSVDDLNLYFYVRTEDALTPHTDPDWMLLYLNLDGDYKTGWMGYDYVVNRKAGDRMTTLERNIGGKYEWAQVGQVAYQIRAKQLVIQIPRSLIGSMGHPRQIDFKWADHCYEKGDWTDFTLNGDAAPNDRFNFRAKLP